MAVRIAQRTQTEQSRWAVTAQLRRGGVAIGDAQVFFMPVHDSIGTLAWTFLVPSVIPSTGAWTLDCPLLSELDPQGVGIVIVDGTTSYPLFLNAGVFSTNASIGAASTISIRGSVEV